MASDSTRIFHITHVDNLPAIITRGGLVSDSGCRAEGVAHTRIGYEHIKARRLGRPVTAGPPGRMLGDFVPFYFAPRSPMLYVINRGIVPGYSEGQEPIVHLVAFAEEATAQGCECLFTDGHAATATATYYEDLALLREKVDWEVMRAKYWSDTESDWNRKWRREAEFLVHGSFAWELVRGIGVINERMRARVEATLAGVIHQPKLLVKREWYY